ncbi:NAD(P)-binding domain-containing protein [Streptococcus sp. CSL7591-lung]|uniref:NAD(P)-binding domain-containing protein n=2 Tax=Streptococcus pacificus TaxID=2740577 RepID=A0ABS0ZHA4_9STRE|nr:NAD(P)-binding domain-containing protein [Streptococcus pacificus]
MKIAVVGTGNIGSRLVKRFSSHGVDTIVIGSDYDKSLALVNELNKNVEAFQDVNDALKAADAVVIALWFDGLKAFVKEHEEQLKGKIIIDPSNNIAFDEEGNVKSLNPENLSSGQQIAEVVPSDSHYVKAFGTLPADQLDATETEDGKKVTLFYATDDVKAGDKVAEVIEKAGWDAVLVGGVKDTGRIEVFGDLHPFGGLEGKLLSKEEAKAKI